MTFPTQLFVDGAWVPAHHGGTFEVRDPATGEVVAEVADAAGADLLRMIDGAAAAQPGWAAMPARERGLIMRRAAALLTERVGDLARLMTREQGKPVEQSVAEWHYGIGFIDWFAEEARRAYGLTIPAATPAKRILALRQPVGVTACITPWNFPALQILRKLGAALAAGCTMIVKPAEQTPLSALQIGQVFHDAGLPPGVLQLAPALDPVPVTEALMDDARVRLISFTGSTEVGKILMRGAAGTLKRVSLELGGHAPFIVFPDADLDLAVREAIASKLRNMGQTCVSPNRLYLHRDVAEEFTARLAKHFAGLVVGPGLDPGVDVGPLIEEAALAKVERHVADAVARGARVVLGGARARVGECRSYFQPTILTGVDESMALAQEETFGPVAPIFTFETDDEVVARANASRYGLAAYFFTNDLNRAVRVAEALEYGTVGVNDASISAVQAPFGGVKESGIGREGGPLGMAEYLEYKYVSVAGL
jgi:succinate-semialdehyde dehydrogenase / glutarate-semialdehyde dehydrogenase